MAAKSPGGKLMGRFLSDNPLIINKSGAFRAACDTVRSTQPHPYARWVLNLMPPPDLNGYLQEMGPIEEQIQ